MGLHDEDLKDKTILELIATRLYHYKVVLIGDKILEQKGKMIPCKRCGGVFKSYCRYGSIGYTYLIFCRTCELSKKNE